MVNLPNIFYQQIHLYIVQISQQINTIIFIGGVVFMLVYKLEFKAFAFPDPILIKETQFSSIQCTSYIQLSFTVTKTGSYRFSFYYVVRSSHFLNNIFIFKWYIN